MASDEQVLHAVHDVGGEPEPKKPALQLHCSVVPPSEAQGVTVLESGGQTPHWGGDGALEGAEDGEGASAAREGAGASIVAAGFVPPVVPHRHTSPDAVRPQVSLRPRSADSHRSQSVDGAQSLGALAGASQAGSDESSLPLTKSCPAGQRADTAP